MKNKSTKPTQNIPKVKLPPAKPIGTDPNIISKGGTIKGGKGFNKGFKNK